MTSLLVTAYFPNICLHKDKRMIRTCENKVGIISKGTVLYAYVQEGLKSATIPSPFFVYTEKSAVRGLISSKQMTMINQMHLLLHGINQFEFVQPTTAGKFLNIKCYFFILLYFFRCSFRRYGDNHFERMARSSYGPSSLWLYLDYQDRARKHSYEGMSPTGKLGQPGANWTGRTEHCAQYVPNGEFPD